MVLWDTAEDIQLIYEHYYEHHESMSVDDMANVLLGLQQLIHMRGQKTFNIFERIVHENSKELTAASKKSVRGSKTPRAGNSDDKKDD